MARVLSSFNPCHDFSVTDWPRGCSNALMKYLLFYYYVPRIRVPLSLYGRHFLVRVSTADPFAESLRLTRSSPMDPPSNFGKIQSAYREGDLLYIGCFVISGTTARVVILHEEIGRNCGIKFVRRRFPFLRKSVWNRCVVLGAPD